MDVPPQQPLEYEVSRVVGLAMQNTVYLAEMYVRQVAHYHVSPNGTGDIAEFEELKMKYGRIAGVRSPFFFIMLKVLVLSLKLERPRSA